MPTGADAIELEDVASTKSNAVASTVWVLRVPRNDDSESLASGSRPFTARESHVLRPLTFKKNVRRRLGVKCPGYSQIAGPPSVL